MNTDTSASERRDTDDIEISNQENKVLNQVSIIFDYFPIDSLLNCRLVCSIWNDAIYSGDLLYEKSCFTFDGRKDSQTAAKCRAYMEASETKNQLWNHLRLRRVTVHQISWINDDICTYTVTILQLHNCTLTWSMVLGILMEFENLEVFIDTQDAYTWDYATFIADLGDDDAYLPESENFKNIPNKEKLESLANIRVVNIHRSQITECSIYLKMFLLRCRKIEELGITTDQNFLFQKASRMLTNLASLAQQNSQTLKSLKFPFKYVNSNDVRCTDEHHIFRQFLNFIVINRWDETLNLPVLEKLDLKFCVIPIEGQDLRDKLLPFLLSLPKLSNFLMECVFLEKRQEDIIKEFLTIENFNTRLGVFINDITGEIPDIGTTEIIHSIQSLSIQTLPTEVREVNELVPLCGTATYKNVLEFQYFSRSRSFNDFNIDNLVISFAALTHLNLIDHNSRIESRHPSQALATIEDSHMQLIVSNLENLVFIKIVGNMTYLTDSGLTGIKASACKAMLKANTFVKVNKDEEGFPISHLFKLRMLILRGLGIKITDITAHFAFTGLIGLKKLHLVGCQQITQVGREHLNRRFPLLKGCDVQI